MTLLTEEKNIDLEHQTLVKEFFRTKCDDEKKELFSTIIQHYYQNHKRDFSWRDLISPYNIVVSEIMLQQTQTDRVAKKFDAFITRFPNFAALANGSLHDVITLWKGLGYNRRAIALHKIAKLVVEEHEGQLPNDIALLETFPSIGKATARSIVTFAFNHSTVFIETNIRTVFIYFFFKNRIDVHDKELAPLIEETLDISNPRAWYYALMDYGVMLKKTVGNLSRLSSHYAKQSKFDGSDRQIRGQILQILIDNPGVTFEQMLGNFEENPSRVERLLHALQKEGFIKDMDSRLWLS